MNHVDEVKRGAGQAVPPVVALGASAGGVEALRQLFAELPPDTGLGFVLIQHLDPDRPSMLASVIAHATAMPVVEVTDGMPIEPNRVHVMPPSKDVSIAHGVLGLVPRQKVGNLHLPIDFFFRALAEDQATKAIGIVLSGSGADGSVGLRAIKAAGGITFAQEPQSAQFRSMPESAIAASDVDFQLAPGDIAHELARLGRHPYLSEAPAAAPEPSPTTEASDNKPLSEVFLQMRRQLQLDFSAYKRPTIQRRIARRLALRRMGTIEQYAEGLRDDPAEVRALAEDILIHVTSFFRDASAFEALKVSVFPELVKNKRDGDVIRIWVPGCSTGEEAYSIVICLREFLEAHHRDLTIKVFGSDLGAGAIEAARAAVYKEADVQGLSSERLTRWFDRVDRGYRVVRDVREACIFVKHDLTREPPFARLDLVSCRNVLIYFSNDLQRRVLAVLHHCLNKPGFLLLGESEGVSGLGELFEPVDKQHRIFLRTGESPRLTPAQSVSVALERVTGRAAPVERREPSRTVRQRADHLLLSRYAPPAVVVDEQLAIVDFIGRTGTYLTPPPGRPQTNVIRMAREELAAHLHDAFETVRSTSRSVRKEGLQIESDGGPKRFDLEVSPLPAAAGEKPFFLVVFDEAPRHVAPERPPTATEVPGHATEKDVRRVEEELAATRDYLQALIAEHESTADALASANEELVAANEELQTTVEELESAKEELQSTNEELGTVNDELRGRNVELDAMAGDLVNVLESVELPILIVDRALRIRRITPMAGVVATVIASDVGRPIDDVKLKVAVDDLPARIRSCMDTNTPKEWEVQSLDGRWYRLLIRPYLTPDRRLDGAILSFVDVDVLKRALREAERVRDYASGIVETVPTPLLVLDGDLRVLSANVAYYETFVSLPSQTESRGFFELADHAWDVLPLHAAVADSLVSGGPFRDLSIECELPRVGKRSLSVSGMPIVGREGPPRLLLAIADVSGRRAIEEERARLLESEKEARLDAQRANHAKDLFLATLSHELRTPLSTIVMSAELLRATATTPDTKRASAAIERAAHSQGRLIDDLLDVSRIVSGKLLLDLQALDIASVVLAAADVARVAAEAKDLDFQVDVDGAVGSVFGDPARLQQVALNLLTNAIKFTPKGGRVTMRLEKAADRARLTVTDTGIGIQPEVIPQLFERFVQADTSMTRTHGGLGLGLAIVRHLVAVHGGEVHAESPGPGRGATFTVTLPLVAEAPHVGRSKIAQRTTAHRLEGLRVLVIDDDTDTREALAAMLAHLGAKVTAVASAAEGIVEVKKSRPEAILCDIAMPVEDGYAFAHHLRSLSPEEGGQTPAAALTALATESDRQQAIAAGFQMHVAKPIDSGRLSVVLATLAGKSHDPG